MPHNLAELNLPALPEGVQLPDEFSKIIHDIISHAVKIDNPSQIMDVIDRIRESIKSMSAENQQKTMQYIQKLSFLAFASGR